MTRLPSSDDLIGWRDRYLRYQALETAALRRNDVGAANRHSAKMAQALKALERIEPDGRDALLALLQNSDTNVRVRAANRVIAWRPDLAVPVLARAMHESFGPESTPLERVAMRQEAKSGLATYLDIPRHDLRPLPDRLAEMGIDLPVSLIRQLKN